MNHDLVVLGETLLDFGFEAVVAADLDAAQFRSAVDDRVNGPLVAGAE